MVNRPMDQWSLARKSVKISTVNARLMYPWYISILHIGLDFFNEYTCLMK